MDILFYIALSGFLVRAEGWHYYLPANPTRLHLAIKRIERFFTAITSGLLFGLMCLLVAEPLTALACSLAYMIWRAPGFRNGGFAGAFDKYLPDEQGWQTWPNMFVRGWWTSAIGFGLVSYAAQGNLFGAIYSVPFAAIYMVVYSGGYRWLPEKILGLSRHLWIEHASGWAFSRGILVVIFAQYVAQWN